MPFDIPLHFEDLTRPAAGAWHLTIPSARDAPSDRLLSDVLSSLSSSSSSSHPILACTDAPSPTFIALYALISRHATLDKATRDVLARRVLKSLLDPVTLSTAPPHALKLALFFAFGLCAHTTARPHREPILEQVLAAASTNYSRSRLNPADTHQVASLLSRIVLNVLDVQQQHASTSTSATTTTTAPTNNNNNNAKRQFKVLAPLLARIVALAIATDAKQKLPLITSLLHLLCTNEQCVGPLVDLLDTLCSLDPSTTTTCTTPADFVRDLVKELLTLPPSRYAHDASASRAIATLCTDLCAKQPAPFDASLSLLHALLGVDVYVMRSGVVATLASLVPYRDDPLLLGVLLERARADCNAFTRSKALQACATLVERQCFPSTMFPTLAAVAAGRLDDKAAAVRKYAAQLLVTMLRGNPYGPVLHKAAFQAKLDALNEQFPDKGDEEKRQQAGEDDVVKQSENDTEEQEEEGGGLEDKENAEDANVSNAGDEEQAEKEDDEEEEEEEEEEDGEKELTEEEKQIILKKTFFRTAVHFIGVLQGSAPTIFTMLRSKSITDVTESIALTVTCIQFSLELSERSSIRRLLPLVLSREQNVREKVIEAYIKLLDPATTTTTTSSSTSTDKDASMGVAKRLLALVTACTVGEYTCIERLIKHLDTIVSDAVIVILLDTLCGRVPSATPSLRHSACVLLSVVAACKPGPIIQRIDDILAANNAPQRWICALVSNLAHDVRLPVRPLLDRLVNVAATDSDLAAVEQAVNALYAVAPNPEAPVSTLIHRLAATLKMATPASSARSACTAVSAWSRDDEGEEEEGEEGEGEKECEKIVLSDDLCRFFVVLGQVVVQQLVRIEKLVSNLRKRSNSRDDKHKQSHTVAKKRPSKVADTSHKDDATDDDDDQEQIMLEADYALEEAEKRLISPTSLIGRYAQFVRRVVRDEAGCASVKLRTAALLCLSKMMCVEASFCENNLRLLFSILLSESTTREGQEEEEEEEEKDKKKDKNEDVNTPLKSNAIIILGDLTFRFPNLVEPWSRHMYRVLQSRDAGLRKNALMVLTHLILNDMIKIKGQIIYIAVCVLDADVEISNVSKLFFTELSRKSSIAIYNILPDLISCITTHHLDNNNNNNVDFKKIITFLISLMDKDRFNDGMVDKLCHRFRSANLVEETRYLAFCISQLAVSARGLVRLNDNFKAYSVAILDDAVYEYMLAAIEKGNKTQAQGQGQVHGVTSQVYEEVVGKVNAVRTAGREEAEQGAGVMTRRRKSLGDQLQSGSGGGDGDGDGGDEEEVKRRGSRRKGNSASKARSKRGGTSRDDEDDDESEASRRSRRTQGSDTASMTSTGGGRRTKGCVQQDTSCGRKPAARRTRKNVVFADDECDE